MCAKFYKHQNGAAGTSHSFVSSSTNGSLPKVMLQHNFVNAKVPQSLLGTIMSLPGHGLGTSASTVTRLQTEDQKIMV
jgi:hypothetical protein